MPSSNNVRKVTSENYPTDSGREGELIFRLVYQQAGCKKPFSRLWLSSMEENAIREGFAHLKPSTEYDALYNGGYSDKYSDDLYKYLKSKNYSDELLRDSGLFNVDERRGMYDKFWNRDRKSTRLNSSHNLRSRMPSSA